MHALELVVDVHVPWIQPQERPKAKILQQANLGYTVCPLLDRCFITSVIVLISLNCKLPIFCHRCNINWSLPQVVFVTELQLLKVCWFSSKSLVQGDKVSRVIPDGINMRRVDPTDDRDHTGPRKKYSWLRLRLG